MERILEGSQEWVELAKEFIAANELGGKTDAELLAFLQRSEEEDERVYLEGIARGKDETDALFSRYFTPWAVAEMLLARRAEPAGSLEKFINTRLREVEDLVRQSLEDADHAE